MNRGNIKLFIACVWLAHAAILFYPEQRAGAQYLHSNGYYAFHGYPDQYYIRQWVTAGYCEQGHYQYVRYYPQGHYQQPTYAAKPLDADQLWLDIIAKREAYKLQVLKDQATVKKFRDIGIAYEPVSGVPLPGGSGYAGYTYTGHGYQQVVLGSTTWGYGAYPGVSGAAEALKPSISEMALIAKQMNDGALAYTSMTYDEAMKFFAARAKDAQELAMMEMRYRAFIATFGNQPSTTTSGYSFKKEPVPYGPTPAPKIPEAVIGGAKPGDPSPPSSSQERMAVLARVLDNNCTACHSKEFGKYAKGGFNIDDSHNAAAKTIVFKQEDQARINAYIDSGKCPQGIDGAPAKVLTPFEKSVLKGK